jgi:hypothetical protein
MAGPSPSVIVRGNVNRVWTSEIPANPERGWPAKRIGRAEVLTEAGGFLVVQFHGDHLAQLPAEAVREAVVEWRCDVRAAVRESNYDDGRSYGVLNVYFVEDVKKPVTQREGLKAASA